jgi:hypothetical protein
MKNYIINLMPLFFLISCNNEKQSIKEIEHQTNQTQENFILKTDTTESKKTNLEYTYNIDFTETVGDIQNFHVYVKTNLSDSGSIEKIAFHLKQKLCLDKCNMTLYDNKETYTLVKKKRELEDEALSSPNAKKLITLIDKKYYVKIADHTIGFLEYSTSMFMYYPLKDGTYNELKNK